ncbi:MAG: DUF86 domain-containing protein [Candidatus Kuenenbacteria bacterium]
MLDKNFIKENIQGIQELLKEINSYKHYSLDEIAKDFHLYASLRYAFIELIERAVDINQHLIKEKDGEVPQDYAETFKILAKMGILDQNFAEKISKSVGMRNVVVHEYRDVDDKRLYNSIDIALDQYPRYCQKILEFIEKEETKN